MEWVGMVGSGGKWWGMGGNGGERVGMVGTAGSHYCSMTQDSLDLDHLAKQI